MRNQQRGAGKGAQRLSVKLLLIVGGSVVGLFISEITLRIIGYTYPVFYTVDEYRGYSLRPGMEGWYRKEGEAYVRINSDGLRDGEHTKAKPANTLRIAVIGDSYAEAFQVPLEQAFWVVMEQKLNECERLAGRKVEVVNFGVSGYGTAQELITLRRHVWDYSPDLVILAFCTANDISDNSRVLKKTEQIPYFVYRDNQLVLDNSFRDTSSFRLQQSIFNRLGRWIRDSLRVIQAIHQAHYAIKGYLTSRRAQTGIAKSAQVQGEAPHDAPNAEELGVDNLIYHAPHDAVWNDAWQVTEKLIELIRDEIQSRGVKFFVVTLSNGIQVYPDPAARQAFMRRLGVSDLFYPDRRIKALGEREGFDVLNVAPALQSYAEQNKVFLHGFGKQLGNGHWNALGHRVAGEMIAQKLCQLMAH